MPTLWEIWTKKTQVEQPLETQYYNPFDLRIGHTVKIDTLDYENYNFSVTALREVKRHGEPRFTDYTLVARPFGGDQIELRMRVVPGENNSVSVVLLKKLDECPYNQEFHEGLAFEKNEGVFTEGEATYWRVNDVKDEWNAHVSTLQDEDHSGKVDASEVTRSEITYWDFWRNVDDAASPYIEFYIVEMDKNTGWFEFWTGELVDQSRVMVF